MTCALVAHPGVERFARWLDRYRNAVLVLSLLLAVAGAYLAGHMKVEASLTNLLPPQQKSVQDLHAISARARPFGTINLLLESDNVELRARAGETLAKKLATVRPDLVAQLVIDDAATQRYAWEHRFLWAKLDDLVAARDALKARIENGKLKANPLYIALDDEETPGSDRFDELEKQLDELEQKAKNPAPRVSKDGRFQLIVIQTTFAGSDAQKANQLIAEVKRAIEATDREVGRGVLYQLTGNITVSMYEHDSVLEGMTAAALLTVGLCALALWTTGADASSSRSCGHSPSVSRRRLPSRGSRSGISTS
jgi:predicted RND superfamily exporter protein